MRHRRVTVGALVASMLGVGLEAIGPLLIREGVNGAIGGDTGVLAPSSVTVLGWWPAAVRWATVEASVWLRLRMKKARRASSCSPAPILSARSIRRGKWCPSP